MVKVRFGKAVGEILGIQYRILRGSASERDYAALGTPHLLLGLAFTWLVGIGRHWDDPRASPVQHLGLGSVVYVFVLAAFLFVTIWPLLPDRWGYWNLLTFVSLTALPAALYAIPVEQWLRPDGARDVNASFLGVVAIWRVGMLWRYLRVWAGLSGGVVLLGLCLPLALIVAALAALNLDHAVFEIMAGIRDEPVGTSRDSAYAIVTAIALLSFFASPVLLVLYGLAIAARVRGRESSGLLPTPRPLAPTLLADDTVCSHEGEASTYCTRCWTNLYELRRDE